MKSTIENQNIAEEWREVLLQRGDRFVPQGRTDKRDLAHRLAGDADLRDDPHSKAWPVPRAAAILVAALPGLSLEQYLEMFEGTRLSMVANGANLEIGKLRRIIERALEERTATIERPVPGERPDRPVTEGTLREVRDGVLRFARAAGEVRRGQVERLLRGEHPGDWRFPVYAVVHVIPTWISTEVAFREFLSKGATPDEAPRVLLAFREARHRAARAREVQSSQRG